MTVGRTTQHPQPTTAVPVGLTSVRDTTRAIPATGTRIDRLTLRFDDADLEAAFRIRLFRSVITSVRAAYILGIATWASWGLMIRQYTLDQPDLDLLVRFVVLIPVILAGLVVTFLPIAERVWEAEAVLVLLFNALVWSIYATAVGGVPFDLGYVGVILIMTFGYTLVRLRFVLMTVTGLAMIGLYLAVTIAHGGADAQQVLLALYYLVSFVVLGMIASYVLERFTRLLFLRERQVEQERLRSESLLLNILPGPVAERLKDRSSDERGVSGAALADELGEVAVLFADLEAFTARSSRMPPDRLIGILDDLFTEIDGLADRHGLEKIKTIGDAYMAVAGVPMPVDDSAGRALGMAVDLHAALEDRRWPSGEPIRVRVGIALGPVVAGVIGRRKFAYDVWGDTVNLASRLEANGRPGETLVSAVVAERVGGRFLFGPLQHLDLKGAGRQPVRYCSGRAVLVTEPGAPAA